ncbi:long-chain-fatty-acid--CoA ligase [Ktedonobacter sp. SOSP1-52]|uniref:long-chain-fatty-acid--CoA ligase n=1 Tax=Ktedonobacter sp. SOSP1-52 TaxID=2778366 RepID=UPI00191624FE|nr:long-chain fatty acid--CoA ligase [Ktedonobacter sp. SOSP1-52]GHO68645.1 long-chain-fatty-acid--CoA ligase [Ktedonobacter sp. SOSP1-52]
MSDPSLINNTPEQQRFSTLTSDGREELLRERPWIRHYQEGVPALLDIPDRAVTSLLDTTASRYPSACAISYFGAKLTYAQLSHLANRFAISLQKLGIHKGDRVAIALPNIPQYPIAFFGALRAGAVVVPTNPLYTAHEMRHQMADSGARVLVMLDDYYPVVREIRKETALEHVILTSPSDYLPAVLRTLYPLSHRGTNKSGPLLSEKERRGDESLHIMSTMLESHATRGGIELFSLPQAAKGDDLALLQYTGGTTGLSKGAMLTHRNLIANAMQTRYWTTMARDAQEITLCAAPFFHAYGLTVGMNLSILIAATMVLIPRFKPDEVLDTIRRTRPTLFPGIPTMYIAILREAGKNPEYLSSIQYCISGAAPLPAKVQTDFESATRAKLVEGYGLSEAAPVTHCNPLNDNRRGGSIGLPLPEVEAAIMNIATGELLPVNEIGEIVVKGPNIMQGYWNRPEETTDIFRNGWMRTGDIGRMDEDGFFYVVDRAKDLILASGFNVYPREVEEVLFRHPSVVEAAVTAVPHEYRGETVGAFIVLKPGVAPSEETRQQIIAFCKEELTAYKVPKVVEFRKNLPKTLVGKVLRRELRVEKQA